MEERVNLEEMLLLASQAGAKEGAKAAIEKIQEEEKKAQKKERDKRLHNTKLLLKNYRKYKRIDRLNHHNLAKLDGDESIDYANMMWRNNQDSIYKSYEKVIKVTHFDLTRFEWAIANWKLDCEHESTGKYKAVYTAIYNLYLRPLDASEKAPTVESIADECLIGRATIFRYITLAVEGLEPYLWGVDIR